MKTFKKLLLIFGICLTYLVMIAVTYHAVARVYRTNDPASAKKVVLLTFFADLFLFGGSGYLIYKLKIPLDQK
ncbi:MAG: hypothetical protein DCC43_05490 [Candidatus Brocadia sp.]|jgi:uncharacterized SAM-binding protein YcdF (DUF218 family)|nr:hypothetical protein [Candidatus Brocadia sp.]MCE7911389.1 hypothetical protein [Candidatus Brocadia sp. AMX3]OQY99112.1 MAG: hypothetical protein B6D35_10130 [Candidatus Brocadia sp. UTAMX2]RIK01740.1 MAG: hypothetical protein DCC43_05490 [Candidatus Brocadia sp.]